MARRYEIVEADLGHVEEMLPSIRQADIDEIWASNQHTPREALEHGIRCSTKAWAGVIDGRVACIFGVAPASLVGGIGVPWMLGTDLVEQHATVFLRRSRHCIKDMLCAYNYLVNYVDNRNTVAIAWLKWLGFEMGEPQPYGVFGLPFRRFEMRA